MKTIKKILLILFLLVSTHWTTQASKLEKQLRFSKLDYELGLSNNTVYSIVQDDKDMLWIATSDGLNRFDGYNFKVYHQENKKENSLLSDIIRHLYIDQANQLWIGSRDGLSRYNEDKDNFENFSYIKSGGNTSQINAITDYSETHLILGTDKGLVLFNRKSKTFENFQLLSDGLTSVQSLYKQKNKIYIGTTQGFLVYDIKERSLSNFNNTFKETVVQTILAKSDNEIWIGTEGKGLFLFNTVLGTFTQYTAGGTNSICSNYIRSLIYDDDNNLWIGTFQGLSILISDEKIFFNYFHNPMNSNSLSQNSIRSIFKDKQGGMWLGTYYGGINYYHKLKNQFGYIKQIPNSESLNDRIVSALFEDISGKIWIGTNDNGVNLYDPVSGSFSYFTQENGAIPSNNIKAFLLKANGNEIYIGSHGGGLVVFNKNTRKSTAIAIPSDNVYALARDKNNNNNIWIGTLSGLFRYNEITQEVFPINTSELNSKQVLFLTIDSKNRLWIGGERSLGMYNLNTNLLTNFNADDYNGTTSNGAINCIMEDSKKNIWFGTRGGICKYEENNKFKSYSKEDGLSNNSVYGIIEDESGKLWLSTNNGLNYFDPVTESFRNYSIYDGLPIEQFNNYAFLKSSAGLLYFGGIDGLIFFYPDELEDNPYTAKPRITKIQISNKEILPDDESKVLTKNILSTETIKLKPNQVNIAFEFVVSNYLSGMHNFFAYKLEGFDKDWNYTSDNRFVNYSNLKPGKYNFMVKAANSDEKWSDETTELKIIVIPPWWKTWWAIILFLTALVIFSYFLKRIYIQRKNMQSQIEKERYEKERNEELNQMKFRFFTNISHEFKTPLTLIISPIQEMLEKTTDKWELSQLNVIQKNANKLLYLVNQLMDYRRAELGVFELKLQYVSPLRVSMETHSLFEKMAKQKFIDYNLIDRTNNKKFVLDLKYFELILTNLLSNAFKFTDDNGKITVTLDEDVNHFILEVEDNGIGIAEDKLNLIYDRFYQINNDIAGTGIGLSLIKRLVDLHHGEITIQSEVGKGSKFSIFFPQDETYYEFEEIERKSLPANGDIEGISFIDENEGNKTDENNLSDEKTSKLLVVEDNEDVLSYLEERLSRHHQVVKAKNGVDALEKLKNNEVDLIITDVMMPEMDGVKFCKTIKQNVQTSHIPVIMLSAKSNIEDQLVGLKVGADDYVPKPFTFSVLRMKIQNMLRSRRMMLEHYSTSLEVEPEKIAFNEMDKEILQRAKDIVMKHLDNSEFSADIFSSEMHMSRSNLHLKLKAITGESTIDFIRKIRFGEASKLLLDGRYNVAEVSTMVGFNTPSYFATSFKKYFGMLPTEYVKKNRA